MGVLGAIDLDPFTDNATELGTAVAAVGAATVTLFVGARTFRFVRAWISKLFKAGQSG